MQASTLTNAADRRPPDAPGTRLAERPGSGSGVVLEVRDLDVGIGARILLHIGSLSIRANEVVAIVGASGSGKTTLLSCISGHTAPLGGTFRLAGRERGAGLRSTYVSRTLQNFPLFHWLTVRGNLELAARIRGVQKPDIRGILASFSAEALCDRLPASLSGGERCRASLSHALLGDPGLLLLDEPFTGLDSVVKHAVATNLLRLAHGTGAAVLFVTHDLHDAVELSDRVIVLGRDGPGPTRIVADVPAVAPDALAMVRQRLEAGQ